MPGRGCWEGRTPDTKVRPATTQSHQPTTHRTKVSRKLDTPLKVNAYRTTNTYIPRGVRRHIPRSMGCVGACQASTRARGGPSPENTTRAPAGGTGAGCQAPERYPAGGASSWRAAPPIGNEIRSQCVTSFTLAGLVFFAGGYYFHVCRACKGRAGGKGAMSSSGKVRKNERGNIVSGYVPDYVRSYSANRRPGYDYFVRRTRRG